MATRHRFELEDGERLLGQWVAGVPGKSGKRTKWGGSLYLTDRRVVWEVIKAAQLSVLALANHGLTLSQAETAAGARIDTLGSVAVRLEDVTVVRPDEERGSVLWIETDQGTMRLLTTAGKLAYNREKDRAVRDEVVDLIRTACNPAS